MTENECERVFALLSEYLDEELPRGTCEQLEEHLRNCPPCIQFVQSLRRSLDLCRRFGRCRELPPLGQDVMGRLHEAYEKMLAKRRRLEDHAWPP